MNSHLPHRVLVIDDQAAIHEDYRKVLSRQAAGSTAALDRAAAELFGDDPDTIVSWEGFEVDSAFQGQEGLELVERAVAERRPYAMAFVDIRMPPGWDGVETVRRIWEIDPEILIVICSAYSDYSWQEMVRALGKNDRYLILRKPFENIEVRQAAMALTERWSQSRTDVLTELLNRRALRSYLELEWRRSIQQRHPLSCAMLDLDFFKRVNDSFGHQAGDEVLKQIAQTLSDKCRANDSIYRYGGEEICVLLPQTTEQNAVSWAEDARLAIESTPIELGTRQLRVTVSVGVAQRSPEDETPERLIDRADQALILAKSAGRNRVYADSLSSNAVHAAGQPWANVTLPDVMSTPFVALKSSASLAEALRFFVESPLRIVPVVNSGGTLVGTLSEQELLECLPAGDRLKSPIESIMNREFETFEADAPVSSVVAALERPGVNRVFVVAKGQLIGAITRGSLLRYWSTPVLRNDRSSASEAVCLIGQLDRARLTRCAERLASIGHRMLTSEKADAEGTQQTLAQLTLLQEIVDNAWAFFLSDKLPPIIGKGPDFSGFGAPDTPVSPLG